MSDAGARGNASAVARQALTRADSAHAEIEKHEEVCAERYGNIKQEIGEIKTILKWAGSTLFLLIIGALAWSIRMQISSAYAEAQALRTQLEVLQRQLPASQSQPPAGPSR